MDRRFWASRLAATKTAAANVARCMRFYGGRQIAIDGTRGRWRIRGRFVAETFAGFVAAEASRESELHRLTVDSAGNWRGRGIGGGK